jgi:hypothetical protein
MSAWMFLLLMAQMQVQPKPDFSGRWVLEGSPPVAVDVGTELVVELSASSTRPRLNVERRSERGWRTESHEIGIVSGVVGGVPPGGAGAGPAPYNTSQSSVTWNMETLVIWKSKYSGPARQSSPWIEYEERWSLDDQGKLHVSVAETGSGREARTFQLVYRRVKTG